MHGYRVERHWTKVFLIFFANIVRNSQEAGHHNDADPLLFTCSDELPKELSRCSFVRTPNGQTTITEAKAQSLISAFGMQKRMDTIASNVTG